MSGYKAYYLLRVLLSALLCAALGVFILWSGAYAVEVFDVLLIAMGVFGIVGNLPPFLLSLRAVISRAKWEWINLVVSLLGMLLGVALMLIRRDTQVMIYLLVGYGFVLPLLRMLLVSERAKQLRLELPKVVFGILLLVVTLTESEDVMFLVLGIALIAVGALYLLFKLLLMPAYFRPYEELIGRDLDKNNTEK